MESIIKRLMENHNSSDPKSQEYLYLDEYKEMLKSINDIVWDKLLGSVDNLENAIKSEVEGYDTDWSGGDDEEIHQLFTDLCTKLSLNLMKNCNVR